MVTQIRDLAEVLISDDCPHACAAMTLSGVHREPSARTWTRTGRAGPESHGRPRTTPRQRRGQQRPPCAGQQVRPRRPEGLSPTHP